MLPIGSVGMGILITPPGYFFESWGRPELQYQRGGDRNGDKAERKRQLTGTGAVAPTPIGAGPGAAPGGRFRN
jgi:hypothetical protein